MGIATALEKIFVKPVTTTWKLLTKPTQAVWHGAHEAIIHPATKYIAAGAATGAALVGYKSAKDKRNEAYASDQAQTGLMYEENIAANHAMVDELARQRAAAIASVANPDAPTNNAAKVEAAKQQAPSLSV